MPHTRNHHTRRHLMVYKSHPTEDMARMQQGIIIYFVIYVVDKFNYACCLVSLLVTNYLVSWSMTCCASNFT